MITIKANENTTVNHKFGSPQKVMYTASSSQYPDYIDDGETITLGGSLAINAPFNTLLDPNLYLSSVVFQVSDKQDFSSNIQTFEPYISIGMPNQLLTAPTGFTDANILVEYNKTYYWRVVATNEIGSTTSKVFSFKTAAQ